MRPSFHPRLVNGPFNDPGLFIPFLFERRAIFFDLGDISAISGRDLLKTSHVFVTHTHMDHFSGFDRLLRLFLGREKKLFMYGPKGFLKNVEGKLSGYSWNLVENYNTGFTLHATEVGVKNLISKEFMCKKKFVSEKDAKIRPFNGLLHKEPELSVYTRILDHKIPSLGFSIQERFHVNIMKDSVAELGLETGPWLKKFKEALFCGKDPESEFAVTIEKNNIKRFTLGDLAKRIAIISPGQKITYIADVVYSRSNVEEIIELAKDSDHLFIEAVFLEKAKETAARKYHLTARQAGRIAKMARVKRFTIFHFSPRYKGKEHLLQKEAMDAYNDF